MQNPIYFAEATRNRFLGADPRTVAVVPIGAIEQHGAHLPVSTDTLILHHVLDRAARACSRPVVVAPMIPFGYSPHHFCYPGVISLQSETVLSLLKDVGSSLIRSGFSRILLLTGHGGNSHIIGQAARDLGCHNRGVVAAAAAYWDIARTPLTEKMRGLTPWIPGHAGLFETSLVMAIRGELVDTARLADASMDEGEIASILFTDLNKQAYFERHDYLLAIQGATDPAIHASRELGEEILDIVQRELAVFIDAFSDHD